ncbi:MAG: TonB-dependent receptor, partial [Deltaproteobacteria bacterium]|nr:TonB-dependent receptor [Deltaproteobacteria bacterium]
SELTLQLYYDFSRHRANRHALDPAFDNSPELDKDKFEQDTWDIDLHYRFSAFEHHEIIWGLGFRNTRISKNETNIFFILDPQRRYISKYSGFIEDDIMLIDEHLKLILGSKFEYNSFTDFEVQPTLRLLWTPHGHHTFWASVSRAVRTPALVEHDGNVRLAVVALPVGPKRLVAWQGTDSFDSEELTAYELGYRMNLNHTFSLDLAAFYNVYDELRTLEPGEPVRHPGYIMLPQLLDNRMDGRTCGIEAAANLQASRWWHLQASATWIQMNLDPETDSRAANASTDENMTPSHWFSLRSLMDINSRLELDTSLYFVDNVPGLGAKRYTNLSVRLGWKPVKGLELALIGQNLLDNKHNEFSDEIYRRASNEVRRSFYGRISWEF